MMDYPRAGMHSFAIGPRPVEERLVASSPTRDWLATFAASILLTASIVGVGGTVMYHHVDQDVWPLQGQAQVLAKTYTPPDSSTTTTRDVNGNWSTTFSDIPATWRLEVKATEGKNVGQMEVVYVSQATYEAVSVGDTMGMSYKEGQLSHKFWIVGVDGRVQPARQPATAPARSTVQVHAGHDGIPTLAMVSVHPTAVQRHKADDGVATLAAISVSPSRDEVRRAEGGIPTLEAVTVRPRPKR